MECLTHNWWGNKKCIVRINIHPWNQFWINAHLVNKCLIWTRLLICWFIANMHAQLRSCLIRRFKRTPESTTKVVSPHKKPLQLWTGVHNKRQPLKEWLGMIPTKQAQKVTFKETNLQLRVRVVDHRRRAEQGWREDQRGKWPSSRASFLKSAVGMIIGRKGTNFNQKSVRLL